MKTNKKNVDNPRKEKEKDAVRKGLKSGVISEQDGEIIGLKTDKAPPYKPNDSGKGGDAGKKEKISLEDLSSALSSIKEKIDPSIEEEQTDALTHADISHLHDDIKRITSTIADLDDHITAIKTGKKGAYHAKRYLSYKDQTRDAFLTASAEYKRIRTYRDGFIKGFKKSDIDASELITEMHAQIDQLIYSDLNKGIPYKSIVERCRSIIAIDDTINLMMNNVEKHAKQEYIKEKDRLKAKYNDARESYKHVRENREKIISEFKSIDANGEGVTTEHLTEMRNIALVKLQEKLNLLNPAPA